MKFGRAKTEGSADAEDHPRDPAKRRTLRKLAGLAASAVATGSLAPENANMQGSYAERHRAARELARDGITAEQKRIYKPAINDALVRGVGAMQGLSPTPEGILYVLGGIEVGVVEDQNERELRKREQDVREARTESERFFAEYTLLNFKASYDAWLMCNGKPQKFGSFGISEYKPTRGTQDMYYYKLNQPGEIIQLPNSIRDEIRAEGREVPESAGKRLVPGLLRLFEHRRGDATILSEPQPDFIDDLANDPNRSYFENITLGRFTVSKGKDRHGSYVSYHDVWDFNGFPMEGLIKPLDIYDRIYYDPVTLKPLNRQPAA